MNKMCEFIGHPHSVLCHLKVFLRIICPSQESLRNLRLGVEKFKLSGVGEIKKNLPAVMNYLI